MKAKSILNFHIEKKNGVKRNINNLLKSKTRDKDKKFKTNDELSKSKTLFENFTSEKNKNNKEKLDNREKMDKKLSHSSTKDNLKNNEKDKRKKTEKESKNKELEEIKKENYNNDNFIERNNAKLIEEFKKGENENDNIFERNNVKLIEEFKKEDNNNDNFVEGNIDKLIEEFKKEYIEKIIEEMDNNYELHNITMNPILNQSLNESMSSSQSFLLSKSMVDEPIPKLPHKDPNKTLTLDEIIKDYKNAFIYVLDFLTLYTVYN